MKQNNAGYDAINGKDKIQIKAHFNSTSMLGTQKPDSDFKYLVVAIYNKEDLNLVGAFQISRTAYKSKLNSVQIKSEKAYKRRKSVTSLKDHKLRNDISFNDFKSIKSIKKIFPKQ